MKKVFLLISLICVIACLTLWIKETNDSVPKGDGYVTTFCGGQLGNQMFKIATVLAYAKDHGLTARFPSLNIPGDNRPHNKEHIFFRIDASEIPTPLSEYKIEHFNYEKIPPLKNVCIEGGLFSWRFFHHRRDEILQAFQPSQQITDKLTTKYSDLLKEENTVAVHVRTYSKQTHELGLRFAGMKFYEDAINKFPDHYTFVIFSDRIHWTKAHFKKHFPGKKLVFIEGNDHVEDLYLMSMMHHQILSISTFSWWSAYLNQHPDKIIYVPMERHSAIPDWIKDLLRPLKRVKNYVFHTPVWSNEDYNLPEWKLVYFSLEPYPEDIYAYDDVTTSVYSGDQ
jgi:hypothetical protein